MIGSARRPAVERVLAVTCGLAVAVVLLFELVASFRRYLVNDDYQLLYTAWLRATGHVVGRDFFVASYHLLSEVLVPLWKIFGESLVPVYLARLVMVAVLGLVAWLVYRVTERLCSREVAPLAPVLALAAPPLIERSLDIRPDLLTTLFWLWAIDLVARRPVTGRQLALLGACVGLAVVNRFKAAPIGVVIPLGIVLAVREAPAAYPVLRRWLWVTGAAGAAAVVAYLAWIATSGDLATFFRVNRELVAGFGDYSSITGDLRTRTLATAWRADRAFWILTVLGALLRLWRWRDHDLRANVLTAALVFVAALSVIYNPAYYEYNLVTLVPLMAPLAAYPAGRLLGAWRRLIGDKTRVCIGAAMLTAAPILGHAPALLHVASDTMSHQRALSQFLLRYTAPDESVFALEGIGLFRPSVYHFHLPEVLVPRYRRGEMNFAAELEARPPTLVVTSYRLPAWLEPRDRAFLAAHFVPLAPYLYVEGQAAPADGEEHRFRILRGGRFELWGEGARLDGRSESSPVLKAGWHQLRCGAQPCWVRRAFPPEAKELVANPRRLPYLLPPNVHAVAGSL